MAHVRFLLQLLVDYIMRTTLTFKPNILGATHNKYSKGHHPPPTPEKYWPSPGRGDLDARLNADGNHHINISPYTEAEREADHVSPSGELDGHRGLQNVFKAPRQGQGNLIPGNVAHREGRPAQDLRLGPLLTLRSLCLLEGRLCDELCAHFAHWGQPPHRVVWDEAKLHPQDDGGAFGLGRPRKIGLVGAGYRQAETSQVAEVLLHIDLAAALLALGEGEQLELWLDKNWEGFVNFDVPIFPQCDVHAVSDADEVCGLILVSRLALTSCAWWHLIVQQQVLLRTGVIYEVHASS
ncbi:hypothetical protein N7508_001640 [Penicillium antarcticum]|uniref:uncharacterized protein n=1 Tax=Penicillium antarcticum TaxID=416450 RepID=UPI0023931681|nr:uncharacterized protein N7508_001640 [Penicillium antarcticum]KAJ5317132.1 hypothetical protein N7508_001640 [Penicillium antarcticum]